MKRVIGFVAVLGLLGMTTTQTEASITFQVNTLFNGTTPPTSTPPWLTATFTTIATNTVQLDLTAGLDVASEFVDEVAFNVDPNFIPSSLSIVQNPLVNPLITSIQATTQNAQDLTGGGAAGKGFDIILNWTSANNAGRFDGADVVTVILTGLGLTENSFNFTNTGGANAHVAAHIQGIPLPTGGTTSAAVKDGPANVVPEPGTLLGALVGLLPIGGLALRRWRNRASA